MRAKPSTVPIQTTDDLHGLPTPLTPRRPPSPSPTDLDEEIIRGRPDFGTSRPFHPTPGPYRGRPHDKSEEEDDSDHMQQSDTRTRRPKPDSQPTKFITEGTQSEEKSTRNVGTMHEPVQTRNFGNEVQPQSSSTQTSFPLKQKPSKPIFTYIERPEPTRTRFDDSYPDQRIPTRQQHRSREDVYYDRYDTIPHDRSKYRSPSPPSPPPPPPPPPPPQIDDYPCDRQDFYYDTQYKGHSYYHPPPSADYHRFKICCRRSPPLPTQQRKPSPPVFYRSSTTLAQDRPRTSIYRSITPSPQRRPQTPTPVRRPRRPSPYRRPHSAIPRQRPQMYSQETDTSLDAMKRRQHAGVQYEPRSTREQGTTPSFRIRKPTTSYRSTALDKSIYSQQRYPTPYSSLPMRHDRSQKNYYIQPTTNDNYIDNYQDEEDEEEEEEEDEEEIASMHDQSTMADLIVSFDHYTQCESQPYMADHYVQTTPTFDEDEQENIFDFPEESDIRQLPRGGSISIPQPTVIQPDSLPRTRHSQRSLTRSKRDGLDYTGNILEVSLHHGQQRVASKRNSPLLNIGTENFIRQSPGDEYTIPFETHYVYESNHSSRSNSSIIAPVLNSARTHLLTNSPVRQSRSNGNFYLSTAPPRSLNSSFRVNITADES